MEGSEKHRRREGWRHHFTPSLVQRRETKPPTYHQLKHPIDFEEGAFCNKEDGERGGTCTHVTHPNWSPSVGAGGETMQTNKLPQCLSGESKDAFKSFFGAIFFHFEHCGMEQSSCKAVLYRDSPWCDLSP